MCVYVCVCGNCQKGLSEDAVCHGHHSSMSVRQEKERERQTLWRLPHLTPACLAFHCLPVFQGSSNYSVLSCQMVMGGGGGGGSWRKGRTHVRGENSCWNVPRYWLMGQWTIGCVCVCACVRRVWGEDGKRKKNDIVCVCGRKDVGFSDVRMTSAPEGRCVKDTPASRGPPECVCVCL